MDNLKNDNAVTYSVSLVSYLDILGMQDLLTRGSRDPTVVADILQRAREVTKPDEGDQTIWGWRSVNFSDLVFRTVPVFTEANKKLRIGLFFSEVMKLCDVQVNLLLRGVMIRGAITYGKIYCDNGLLFGPALVQGYRLESQRARFPRIILDSNMLRLVRGIPELRQHPFTEEMGYLRSLLEEDKDGHIFLSYLSYMSTEASPRLYARFLRRHKEIILEKYAQIRGDRRTKEYKRKREKIAWMASYHSRHLSTINDVELKKQTATNLEDLKLPWWA